MTIYKKLAAVRCELQSTKLNKLASRLRPRFEYHLSVCRKGWR